MDSLCVRCAKFHHCRICVIDFREGGLFAEECKFTEAATSCVVDTQNTSSYCKNKTQSNLRNIYTNTNVSFDVIDHNMGSRKKAVFKNFTIFR